MTDTDNETETDEPICGSTDTHDGEPCERTVLDGGLCYHHDPDKDVPDEHGAPSDNVNAMTTGAYMDHNKFVRNLPVDELGFLITVYREFLQESVYEFDEELEYYKTFPVEEVPEWIPDDACDEEGDHLMFVPKPKEHEERAIYLWEAAINMILMNRINAVLTEENMEKEVPAGSKYVDGEWVELTEKREHHYNLTYDRLVRQQGELMKLGGVEPVPGRESK